MGHQPSEEEKSVLDSRYALVIAVAKRAKQLREGAPRLVDSKSKNLVTVAMEEIAAGKVKISIPTPEELAAAEQRGIAAAPVARGAAELLRVAEISDKEEEEEAEAGSGPDQTAETEQVVQEDLDREETEAENEDSGAEEDEEADMSSEEDNDEDEDKELPAESE